MLPALENVPQTPEAWAQFSFDHRDSHARISAGIQKVYGIRLIDYQIDPIDLASPGLFLQNNSSLHSDMNAVLNLQSTDLEDVDFTNKEQFIAWVKLHYQEHYNAEALLGANNL